MQQKTLSQFKKDITIGLKTEIIKFEELDSSTPRKLAEVPVKEKLQGVRLVSYKDTTGFYLKHETDESNKKGSFCGWPKASELKYIGDIFEISCIDIRGNIWQKRTYQIIKN